MATTDDPLPCSVLLLAGGQGQRMGGADKGLIEWQGRPLVAWITDVARPVTDDLIISCNRHADRYAVYADHVVADDVPDYPGPLAGIRAGLASMRHAVLLVLPCDAPRVDRTLLDELAKTARLHPGQPVVVRRGDQWEPLFCALPRSLQPAIEAAWQAGERSPRRLWQQFGAVALQCNADDPRLMNFNTPRTLGSP
ncbi:MAG TPA: molybdenum cofactor guanylyltransferase MobA [Moraxellaceae bacterium]|nr:molybdenum cofactor guanylyltransferase MobA [Moraxellaceae bacterium]